MGFIKRLNLIGIIIGLIVVYFCFGCASVYKFNVDNTSENNRAKVYFEFIGEEDVYILSIDDKNVGAEVITKRYFSTNPPLIGLRPEIIEVTPGTHTFKYISALPRMNVPIGVYGAGIPMETFSGTVREYFKAGKKYKAYVSFYNMFGNQRGGLYIYEKD